MAGVTGFFRRMMPSGEGSDEPEPESCGSGKRSAEGTPTRGDESPSSSGGGGGQTNMPNTETQTVSFWMRVENVHYPLLADDPGAYSSFEGAIKHAVASEAGDGILPHCVELRGRPLLLQAVIYVPYGISAVGVQGKLDNSVTIADTIVARINKVMPEPGELFTGPISVSNVSDCEVDTVFEGTWKRGENVYVIRGGAIFFPSGGTAEIIVTSANTFSITHPSGISLAARLESDDQRLKWSNGSVWKYAADQGEGGEVITAMPSVNGDVEEEEVQAMHMPAFQPQKVQGNPVWPQQWGVTRTQCRELLRQLRADPSWSSENNIYSLVADYIVPKTSGTGIGYALLQNQGVPREVNVLVTYAWAQNAEEFLEAVLRSTTEQDVLFICSLSLYQAEDGAGPSIAEQLGAGSVESPFQRVLEQIQERCKSAGRRWQWRSAAAWAPMVPLVLAAAFLLYPMMIWRCVPTHDMSRCAVRVLPALGAGWDYPVEWSWSQQYEEDWAQSAGWVRSLRTLNYLYVVLLVALHFLVRWLLQNKCGIYNGRVLIVPSRGTYLSNRLWCIAHILDAKRLDIPVVFASTLAPIGYRSARRAECSGLCDEGRLRKEIEAKEGGPRCYSSVNRTMRKLAKDQLFEHWLTMARWALVLATVCFTDLCLVVGEVHSWGTGTAALSLCLVGILFGVFTGACAVLCATKDGKGAPNWSAVAACAGALLLAGLVILLVLVGSEVIASAGMQHWAGTIDLLSDDGNRHHHPENCKGGACRRATAFLTSLAQTWLLGGIHLLLLVLGALFCPAGLRHRQRVAALIGMATLVVVAFVLVLCRAKASTDGGLDFMSGESSSVFPSGDHAIPVLVFYLVQLSARCVAPIGIMWCAAWQWGVLVGAEKPFKPAPPPAASSPRGKRSTETSPLRRREVADDTNTVTTL